MLRSELQVALNDAIVAAFEAADGHEAAAEVIEDAGVADLLRSFAGARRAAAEELGEHLRALGDLPKVPDSDLETLRDLLSQIKAGLSPDGAQSLLADRAYAEQRVVETARAALALEDRPAARATLERLERDALAACERLTPAE